MAEYRNTLSRLEGSGQTPRPVGAPGGERFPMLEAYAPSEAIRWAYNLLSRFYGMTLAPLERKPRLMGLERAAIQPEDSVLEVAVGPGPTLLEIVRRVARTNVVYGAVGELGWHNPYAYVNGNPVNFTFQDVVDRSPKHPS